MSSLMSSFQYLVDMAQKHPDTLLNLDIASTSKWLVVFFFIFSFYIFEGGGLKKTKLSCKLKAKLQK